MKVAAKPDTLCPKEDDPRAYVGETPEEVPDTSYYRRLVADGSLVLSPTPRPERPEAKKKGA